ncbi:DUF4406 domain protein [Nocardia phage NS-I]|nr:DUF4406 domain protein [Nocardia phage NS-I]
MRVYLAGPMTVVGPPTYNYPAFFQAEAELLQSDPSLEITNPAREHDDADGNPIFDKPHTEYMRTAVLNITECDAVILLPGWERSPGVRVEITVAQALGLPVTSINEWRNPK